MITAVDTNILLDLLLPDPEYGDSSGEKLAEAWRSGAVILCGPVYAELAGRFQARADLDRFLLTTRVRLEDLGVEALHLAGQVWLEYSRRRPSLLACPRCGMAQSVRCRQCSAEIRPRQHIVADFMIGAHASMQADRLLTRDAGYYRTYFPQLVLV